MSGVPDPTPIEPVKLENEATAANGAPTDNSGNATAMQLFAPDPNAGPDQEPLDLDELFHDCYFGDFGVPENVSSSTIAAVPIPAGEPAAKRTAFADAVVGADTAAPAKRTADQAGLTTQAAPRPAPAPSSVGELGGISTKPAASLTEVQKVERRERNREHAKRSRLRKKFLLESLQEQIEGLQSEISALRGIIKSELPDRASALLKSLGGDGDDSGSDDPSQPKKGSYTPIPLPSGFGPVKTLMEPDYRLMSALSGSQQNFAISDPSLPDNPIVYVSQGFLGLTGYTLDQVLGRNCRFLQGPGTDQAAVDVIRKGVREGTDTSVCLLNYKADGTPFWNQFFVAALRDAENNVVNFVGVQCEVSKAVVEKHISEGKTPASSLP